jgi:hypothetical protein
LRPHVALALLVSLGSNGVAAAPLEAIWQGTSWGENSAALMRHFGDTATHLPRPLDFGDSYVDLVVRDADLGGVQLIAYFQMDKATGGLKRLQFELPRHRVNPPAFRAVSAALGAAYHRPDLVCGMRPGAGNGYQAAAIRLWRRDGAAIRAIFRDTSLEAYDGCFFLGTCGLTGQLLIRISPPGADAAADTPRCVAPPG